MKLLKIIFWAALGIGIYYVFLQKAPTLDKPTAISTPSTAETVATPLKAVTLRTAAQIKVEAAVVKVPTGSNTAGYMKITNIGQESEKLISVACTFADKVELHEHSEENGIMKMRRVNTIEIPAGKSIELVPGGKHIMFFNVRKDALQEKNTVVLTLEFEKAGMLEIECSVQSIAAVTGTPISASTSGH